MRILKILILILIIGITSCEESINENSIVDIQLIPKPQKLNLGKGSFIIDKNTTIFCETEFNIASQFLSAFLQNGANLTIETVAKSEATIIIELDITIPEEGYTLDISDKNIIIRASGAGGAFYGIQTLRQLMPPSLERTNSDHNQKITLPQLTISDAPKFKYRGMHLDVGRHFFPKEFIKEYIANLALFKINYFHWHLTEDQGWRIEIKKYPKLTSEAAYRNETLIGHYNDTPQLFDGKKYGGFYTQEDIKEIVSFASKHNVTIIPEIEMPGHAQAAISAYPEFGCTGKQVEVATKWGVFENIYCPKEQTFIFLKEVLLEVMELFPGEYIHIGGDESPKTQWKNCNNCQKLIKEHNLVDEDGLQSYFIREMESFVNSKGKKIIGWDEILEGGLAPHATVMSWRGTQGGIEAAKKSHNVIMTPGSHAYFDYYQSENSEEPLAIGGFLPLKKVYSFNPIPEELNSNEAKYILGAQGNVWTEYISTENQAEYMVFPRMLAMSEVVWSGPTKDIETDYPEFLSRLEPFLARLDALNINYANHLYEIEGKVIKKEGKVFYELKTPMQGKEIRYSLSTSEERSYDSPVPLNENTVLKANVYKNGEKVGRPFSETIEFHKAVNGKISINVEPHKTYSTGGKEALINGVQGSNSRYGDKEWLGFWGDDLEITIDLLKETEINSISFRFYNAQGQWIYAPESVSISARLSDVQIWSTTSEIVAKGGEKIINITIPLEKTVSNKVMITIPNYGIIPEGMQGSGNKAWTFIDEIIIK